MNGTETETLRSMVFESGLPAVLRTLADVVTDMREHMNDADYRAECIRRANLLRALAADISGE